jgi:aspartyl-tRNA(Asn)/glutamyl-tRNA(Gln) amidotransferase subunit A
VEDAAILFHGIAGRDQMDATSVDSDYGTELLQPDMAMAKKLKIGIPKEYFIDGVAPEVREAV